MTFIDKDQSGEIDYQEFSEIFGVATTDQAMRIMTTQNERRNLMMVIEKAFLQGYNVEEMFLKEDPCREGSIKQS